MATWSSCIEDSGDRKNHFARYPMSLVSTVNVRSRRVPGRPENHLFGDEDRVKLGAANGSELSHVSSPVTYEDDW